MRKPKLPKKLTVENVRKYKAAVRKWDQWRIDSGIATPEEIQNENSMIPRKCKIEVLGFPDLLDI